VVHHHSHGTDGGYVCQLTTKCDSYDNCPTKHPSHTNDTIRISRLLDGKSSEIPIPPELTGTESTAGARIEIEQIKDVLTKRKDEEINRKRKSSEEIISPPQLKKRKLNESISLEESKELLQMINNQKEP